MYTVLEGNQCKKSTQVCILGFPIAPVYNTCEDLHSNVKGEGYVFFVFAVNSQCITTANAVWYYTHKSLRLVLLVSLQTTAENTLKEDKKECVGRKGRYLKINLVIYFLLMAELRKSLNVLEIGSETALKLEIKLDNEKPDKPKVELVLSQEIFVNS